MRLRKFWQIKRLLLETTLLFLVVQDEKATLQYVVLKHLLNYPKVRIYEGSWTEYSTQKDLPVATGEEKLT